MHKKISGFIFSFAEFSSLGSQFSFAELASLGSYFPENGA